MIDFSKTKHIIFDCDGVIFDSNELKSIAFSEALKKHGVSENDVSAFLTYHKTNGGISRYVKLKYLITDILKVAFDTGLYNSLIESYAIESLKSYLGADLTDGCEDFLKVIKQKGATLYVASGSDEEELKTAFKAREIDQYFEAIYGSPKTKHKIVSELILPGLDLQQTILIGDAPGDLEVASLCSIEGIGVEKYAENKAGLTLVAQKNKFTCVSTLKDIILVN